MGLHDQRPVCNSEQEMFLHPSCWLGPAVSKHVVLANLSQNSICCLNPLYCLSALKERDDKFQAATTGLVRKVAESKLPACRWNDCS